MFDINKQTNKQTNKYLDKKVKVTLGCNYKKLKWNKNKNINVCYFSITKSLTFKKLKKSKTPIAFKVFA